MTFELWTIILSSRRASRYKYSQTNTAAEDSLRMRSSILETALLALSEMYLGHVKIKSNSIDV